MALGMILENGWPECDLSDTERLTIPGTALSLPIQKGQPHAILQAFFRDVHEYNEPCTNARGLTDEGSWTEDNSVYTSNHKGATAVDWNWSDHPVRIRDAGWNGSVIIPGNQVPQMRELLAWYEGMVFWGNDWNSFIDSMHFQMGYNTYGRQNFDRVHSFIQRKIRADGYSTYRRGGVPRGGGTAVEPSAPANPIPPTSGLTAQVLWDIAERPSRMPLRRYEELLPALEGFFEMANCNTIDRRAMAIAQLFHESGCLYYTEEIADGSAYEGRCQGLGNCQPGDGKRFKGRGPIQLTGRANYTAFSGWMYRNGRCPTPTHYVDNPHLVSDPKIGFLAAAFYWTVSRPKLNEYADARNIEAATYAINGGYNGLEDRKKWYRRALDANANLLSTKDPWEELMATKVKSLSIYATPGEAPIEVSTMIAAIDAHGPHEQWVEEQARHGHLDSIRRIALTAGGGGEYKDARAIQQAMRVLTEIRETHPEYIIAATGKV